eukprot:TRINITY_DN16597_c0_g2_i1.p1 TRINITY_DN16597_c0_g2~~TRINITY_DN16597_c0_g2_i1.p1  ORF type:complete len:606 (-),score=35.96 TRINITY_DN16597_c0_g2_i1:213-2030(-)
MVFIRPNNSSKDYSYIRNFIDTCTSGNYVPQHGNCFHLNPRIRLQSICRACLHFCRLVCSMARYCNAQLRIRFSNKVDRLYSVCCSLCSLLKLIYCYVHRGFRSVVGIISRPIWAHLCYFLVLSFAGTLILQWTHMRNEQNVNPLDAFFTAVSATTVSSLGSIPMQDFSHFQLMLITLLMSVGGEVFTSMLCLHLRRFLLRRGNLQSKEFQRNESVDGIPQTVIVVYTQFELTETIGNGSSVKCHGEQTEVAGDDTTSIDYEMDLSYLGLLALFYMVTVQLVGILLISLYYSFSGHNKQVLKRAGLNIPIFTVFTVVSSFANCGFTPLNDNMMSFRKDPLTLFVIGVVILLGNKLYAPALWALVWISRRLSRDKKKQKMQENILNKGWKIYEHIFPGRLSFWLVISNMGMLAGGSIALCLMQWREEIFEGLEGQHKVAVSLFQSLSVRHAGENVVNPGLIHPAVVLLYIILMYIPAYPLYCSSEDEHCGKIEVDKRVLKDATYILIPVFVLCITERDKVVSDPLNFKILNIVFEVVSGYGNVGMSIGYSCALLGRIGEGQDPCTDVGISLSAKFSAVGKLIIITVMLFGRLKTIRKSPHSCNWLY